MSAKVSKPRNDDTIIALELKMSLSFDVIRQAALNQLVTERSFAAVPTWPMTVSLEAARKVGIGVLRISQLHNNAQLLLPPAELRVILESSRDKILHYCRQSKPGGIAGLPTLAGPGAARRCHAAILRYLIEEPEASWRMLYREIPNHYLHARSLASAMCNLENISKVVSERIPPRDAPTPR